MSTMPASETLLSCSGCGATVYPEHLERHMAGYWAGTLYCKLCLTQKKSGTAPPPIPEELTSFPLEEVVAESANAVAPAAPEPPKPAVPTVAPMTRRAPRPGSDGATRVHIFHARLSDGAVAHLDHQINDWLDQNPDVEVKFANTTVGTWEGKHPEPNLIMALFY
jgi:hypothetical protein